MITIPCLLHFFPSRFVCCFYYKLGVKIVTLVSKHYYTSANEAMDIHIIYCSFHVKIQQANIT